MLRLLLGMLPVLMFSAFTAHEDEGDSDDDGQPGDATGDDNGGDSGPDIDAEVQKRLNSILGTEKKKLRQSLRDEIRQELEAERERKQHEEAEEFRPLYESEKAEREKAERLAQETEARYQQRIIRSEIKLAASTMNFHKPDVAWKLIDHDAVEFDSEGEPTNVETLVKAVADEHPYLIKSEESDRRAVEHVRSNGGPKTKEDIKNSYLQQAGRRR